MVSQRVAESRFVDSIESLRRHESLHLHVGGPAIQPILENMVHSSLEDTMAVPPAASQYATLSLCPAERSAHPFPPAETTQKLRRAHPEECQCRKHKSLRHQAVVSSSFRRHPFRGAPPPHGKHPREGSDPPRQNETDESTTVSRHFFSTTNSSRRFLALPSSVPL